MSISRIKQVTSVIKLKNAFDLTPQDCQAPYQLIADDSVSLLLMASPTSELNVFPKRVIRRGWCKLEEISESILRREKYPKHLR